MQRRLEAFERRLAALDAMLRAWSREGERERKARARGAVLASMLRAGLECAGVDPGEALALRHLEEPDEERPFIRPRPFVHPLRRLAERQRPRPLIEALEAATKRYQQGPAPDPRRASAMQLIGYYCFGPGNRDRAVREVPA
jgi:hypothetical protein